VGDSTRMPSPAIWDVHRPNNWDESVCVGNRASTGTVVGITTLRVASEKTL
jgi:hypothetical protein